MSHYSGACRCKLTPCSTYQSGSGVLFVRKRMALLRCFYTVVPLQCQVLESRGECTELVIRFKLYGCPHCCGFSRRAAWSDGRSMCVFANTTDGQSPLLVKKWTLWFLLSYCRAEIFHGSLSICSISDQNLTESAYWVWGFAIKNCIDILKKQPCVLLYLSRWKSSSSRGLPPERPSHGPDQIEKQSPELLFEQTV